MANYKRLIFLIVFSALAQMAFTQLPISLGTLQPGDTLCVIYDAKINDNIASNMVSVQCKVTADGSIVVLSDDPDTGTSGDATITDITLPLDYGDAPDPVVVTAGQYPTLFLNDGARHVVIGSTPLKMGANIDADADGQPSMDGTGDDVDGDGDDEDGVTLPINFAKGTNASITINASAPALINAWIDFDQNGVFDAMDQVLTDVAVAAGDNNLNVSIPATAMVGMTFARFRLSTAGGLGPTGLANDGEVEDYQVTIIDNAFSVNDPMVSESGTSLIFTITRNSNTNADSVDFVITGTGTAIAGTDFTDITSSGDSTLVFPAGGTNTIMISVPITNDMIVEANETIIVMLNDAKGAGISKATGTGTITDDDKATFTINDATIDESAGNLMFTVSLDKEIDIPVAVDVKFTDETAAGGTDYTSSDLVANFNALDNADKTISVPITADDITELDETFQANLSTSTVLGTRDTMMIDTGIGTITNDDTTKITIIDVSMNEGHSGMVDYDFIVSIDKAVDVGFTVDANTCDSTATTADGDYVANTGNMLTFAGTVNEMETFTVQVNGDPTYEHTDSFLVKLTNIAAMGRSVCFMDSIGVGKILNDDTNPVILSVSPNAGTEAGTTTITVTATSSQAVLTNETVLLTVTGTGILPGDYILSNTTITIPTGMTSGSVTFTIVDDDLPEGTETATITMSNPSAGLVLGSTIVQIISITDNDMMVTLTTYNNLTFGDPCSCMDPLNCRVDDLLYFHDTLVIPESMATTTGLNIRIESASNFFIDVPCTGGALTPITPSLDDPNTGTQIPEVSPGVYKLEFWRPDGLQPTLVVDAYTAGGTKVINDQAALEEIFQPLCTVEACIREIPTLGQWGIILLILILVTFGVLGMKKPILNHV